MDILSNLEPFVDVIALGSVATVAIAVILGVGLGCWLEEHHARATYGDL